MPNTDEQAIPPSANAIRAASARSALDHFMRRTNSDNEDAIADLLTSIQHLCKLAPSFGDFQSELERSVRNFESSADDDPVGDTNIHTDPVVVVEMDGGAIRRVISNGPARVIFLDDDTESSGEVAQFISVNGAEVYFRDYTLAADASLPLGSNDGVSPLEVADILEQIPVGD